MITEINWTESNIDNTKNKNNISINEKSLRTFYMATNGTRLTAIVKKDENITKKYNEWQDEVTKITKNVFKKVKNKGNCILKSIRKLSKIKKTIKNKKINTKKKKKQLMIINDMIEQEIKKDNANKTIKTAKNMSKAGKLNLGAFWDFKKRMDNNNKKETPSSMINKENIEKSNKLEIKKIFEEFYEDLFTPNTPDNEMERMAERITQYTLNEIMEQSKKQRKYANTTITKEKVNNGIDALKNKSSIDSQGLSNKILKNAGNDMTNSIAILFNQINYTMEGPEAWEK